MVHVYTDGPAACLRVVQSLFFFDVDILYVNNFPPILYLWAKRLPLVSDSSPDSYIRLISPQTCVLLGIHTIHYFLNVLGV